MSLIAFREPRLLFTDGSILVSRLTSMPLSHMYAFPLAHVAPLYEGIPTYIVHRFEASSYRDIVNKNEITETSMVPAMMRSILHLPCNNHQLLKSLRLVWSAGPALNAATEDRMCRLLAPESRVFQVYDETAWITAFQWPEKDHTGRVHRPLDSTLTNKELFSRGASCTNRSKQIG